MVEHKLVSFATIVRLCRVFHLYYYTVPLQWKQTPDTAKILTFLPLCCDSKAMSKNISFRSPAPECSYGKIFIHNTEISVAKSKISVTGAARLLIWRNRILFFQREEQRGEFSEIEPAQLTELMKRPSSHTCESEVAFTRQTKVGKLVLANSTWYVWKAQKQSANCLQQIELASILANFFVLVNSNLTCERLANMCW